MQAPPATSTASWCERHVEKTPGLASRLSSRPEDDATNHSPALHRADLLSPYLQRVTKAPLKPEQCIFALKVTALSKLYCHMEVEQTTVNELTRAGWVASATIRQWLVLHSDILTGYSYAPVRGSGDLNWLL